MEVFKEKSNDYSDIFLVLHYQPIGENICTLQRLRFTTTQLTALHSKRDVQNNGELSRIFDPGTYEKNFGKSVKAIIREKLEVLASLV